MKEIRVNNWGELREALFADSWIEELGRFRSRCAYRGLSDAAYPTRRAAGFREGGAATGAARRPELGDRMGDSPDRPGPCRCKCTSGVRADLLEASRRQPGGAFLHCSIMASSHVF